jgi:hypothetical protein
MSYADESTPGDYLEADESDDSATGGTATALDAPTAPDVPMIVPATQPAPVTARQGIEQWLPLASKFGPDDVSQPRLLPPPVPRGLAPSVQPPIKPGAFSERYADSLALGWDDAYKGLYPDQKKAVDAQLFAAPDKAAEKITIVNTMHIAQMMGVDPRTVRDHYSDFQGSYAHQMGWDDAVTDPGKFNAHVVTAAKHEQAKGLLGYGPVDDTPDAAKQRETSAQGFGYTAGRINVVGDESKDAPDAWQHWLESAKKNPDFDPKDIAGYYPVFMASYQQGRADNAAAEQAAVKIHDWFSHLAEGQKAIGDKVTGAELPEGQDAMTAAGMMLQAMPPHLRAMTMDKLQSNYQPVKPTEGIAPDIGRSFVRGIESLFTSALENPKEKFHAYLRGEGDRGHAKTILNQNIREDLENWRQGKLDPIDQSTLTRRIVTATAEMVPGIAVYATGLPGFAAMASAYSSDSENHMVRSGVPAGAAQVMAPIVGGLQALMDKADISLWKKFPGLGNIVGKWGNGFVRGAADVGINSVAMAGIQWGKAEAIPGLVQDIGAFFNKEIPGEDWGKLKHEFWTRRADDALVALPLMLFGLGHAKVNDFKAADQMVRSPEAMRLVGIRPEHIAAIEFADPGEAAKLFLKAFPERVPMMEGDSMTHSPSEAAEMIAKEQAKADAATKKATKTGGAENDRSSTQPVDGEQKPAVAEATISETNPEEKLGPPRCDDNGWYFMKGEQRVDGGSLAVVESLRNEQRMANSEKGAQAYVDIIDSFQERDKAAGVKTTDTLTGKAQIAEIGPNGVEIRSFSPKAGEKPETVKFDPATTDELGRQMKLLNVESADINGRNWIADDLGKIAHTETNQSRQGVLTVVHERMELAYKRGAVTDAETRAAATALAPVFTADADTSAALARIASGKASATEARETMVELAVSNEVSLRKDGSRFKAGALTAGIEDAIHRSVDPAQRKALGKLRAYINVVKAYLKSLFGAAKALRDARAKGLDLKEFDAWADKLLGRDGESKMKKEAAKKAAEMHDDAAQVKAEADKAEEIRSRPMNEDGSFSLSAEFHGKSGIKEVKIGETTIVVSVRTQDEGVKNVEISSVRTKTSALGNGSARRAMNEFLASTDEEGVGVSLLASPLNKSTSRGRLVSFYKSLGFEETGKSNSAGDPYMERKARSGGESFSLSHREGEDLTDWIKRLQTQADAMDEGPKFKGVVEGLANKDLVKRDKANDESYGDWAKRNDAALAEKYGVGPGEFAVMKDAADGSSWTIISPDSERNGSTFSMEKGASDAEAQAKAMEMIQGKDRQLASFSVSPSTGLDLIASQIERSLRKNPEARIRVAEKAKENIDELKGRWGNGLVSDKMTKGEMDAEESSRRKALESQYETEAEASLTDSARAALAASPSIFDPAGAPIMESVLKPQQRKNGRLITLPEGRLARRMEDTLGGEYDGAEGLPRWLFRGNVAPDQMAQEMHDAGLIKDAHTDTMWDAIRQELNSIRDSKDAKAAAEASLKEATGLAKERAFVDAQAWRKDQEERQSKDWNPREALVRDLTTLDAITAALPSELRGKVGGYVALAKLATNEARVKEIQKRIGKMSDVLERHLKKEIGTQFDTLLERAMPTRDAGTKPKGKIGVDAHRYFDEVRAVAEMTPAQIIERRAGLDAAAAKDGITPEEAADIFEREQILDTFGGFKNQDAARMAKGLERAQEVYEQGRNKWRVIEEERQAEIIKLTGDTVKALGGIKKGGIQAQKVTEGELKGLLSGGLWDLKSFSETMDSLLGNDHPLAQRWSRVVREGFAEKTDEMISAGQRWSRAIESATGKKGREAREAVFNMGDPKRQTVEVTLSPSRTEKIQVPIEKLQAVLDGSAKADSLGLTPEEVQALSDQFMALPDKSNVKNLTLERPVKGDSETVKYTEAEAVYLTMLGAQEAYRKSMDAAGYDAEALAQMESQLSPAAKDLRKFMADEYAAGYEPLARQFRNMYGVDLPQIPNYAPGLFYHRMESGGGGLDITGSGVQQGGFRAGFLKDRTEHSAPPRAENAFQVFFGHLNQTAHWKALAEATREMRAVLGHADVRQAIEGNFGRRAQRAVSQWLNSIEGNGLKAENGRLAKWLYKVQSSVALSWNIGTAVKQSMAILNPLYSDMPAGQYLRGLGKLMTGRLEWKEMWNSDLIQRRLAGGFAPEVRAVLDDIWGGKPTRRAEFVRRGMEIHGVSDALFTTSGAAIYYDWALREAKKGGLSDSSAKAYAMDKVADSISRTAQPVEVSDRSLMEQKLGGMGKFMFAFASEARQKSSLWLNAWAHTLTGKATAQDVKVLLVSHLVVGPIIQTLINALRDAKDDNDEWGKDEKGDDKFFGFIDPEHWNARDYMISMMAGPLSGIPFLKDAVDALQGHSGSGPLSRVTNAVSAAKAIATGPKDTDPEGTEFYLKKIAKVLEAGDPFTAVATHAAEQVGEMADNLYDSPDEKAAQSRRTQNKQIRDAREANKP